MHKEIYPISPWPKDPKLKERGRFGAFGVMESLPSYSLALFTRVLGRSRQEVDQFCERVRQEITTKSEKNRYFGEVWSIYARKPEEEEVMVENMTST